MPDLIGRYTVSGLLGTGGFAVVWLGHDDRLDDQVAIKVLAENWSQRADLRIRFEQEARVLRRTKSHRVVEVYDIGELPDGRPYFVMTYADRGSLADALRGPRMPVASALRHGADIAYGIQDLHDAGVMHRDVKPSNVLFRTGARGACDVLIADLGLSRELERGSRFTAAVGTPGYMAPELSDPDLPIDSRADIYGIGATVYFALTGRPPVWNGEVLVPPGRLRPGLPNGVDATVRRALARNPHERWKSAAVLGEVLRELSELPEQEAPAESSDMPSGVRSAVTVATSGARTGDVLTTQLVRAPGHLPVVDAGPPSRRRVLRPVLAAGAVIGVIVAAGLVHAFRPDGADGADARPTGASTSASAAPGLAQPTEAVTATTTAVPSPTTTAAGTTAVAAPVVPTEATTRPAVPPPPTPLPGTLTRCSTEGGRDHFECFLFSRGNTAYALDFRANDYEVLMWTRKSDDDPYAWSQRWQFWRIEAADAYMIYNRHSARCLTLDDPGVGAYLHARPCDPASPNQHWRWTDTTSWILRSALGKCIDVPRSEYFNGQPPFGYECSGDLNQRWLLRAV
jgi:hypothetical protein